MIEFELPFGRRQVRVRAAPEEDALWVGERAIRAGWSGEVPRICLPGDGGPRARTWRDARPLYRRAVRALLERVGERAILNLRDE